MSPAMDYKGATGIRARGDLSPNDLTRDPHMTAWRHAELTKAAQTLIGLAKESRGKGVTLNKQEALRVADAMLLAAHVLEGAQ